MREENFAFRLVSFLILFIFVFSLNAQNLLVNPDAETGDTQGWVDPDNAWSAANDITPHGGNYFFWPAKLDLSYTEMYQDVDLSAYISDIDAGNAWFNLTGWLANWDQYPHDRATLALEGLNSDGQQLFYVSRDHRSPVWTQYQLEGNIPAGTRTFRVHLIATRFVGSDNDGYFDDLSLTVNNIAPSVSVSVSSENDATELPVDGTLQLTAQTIGGTDSGYNWSSSFEAVATVDTNGLVTAHQAGRFSIQATGKNSGKTGFIELTAFSPEDIVFQSPGRDMELTAGSAWEVTWEVKGSISTANLSYSLNGGSDWNDIAEIDSIASGHYFWMVPDTNATLNDCYLKMQWDGGESVSSKFSVVPNATAIEGNAEVKVPAILELLPNYPNPFNPVTHIKFNVVKSAQITISILNSTGQQVAVLLEAYKSPGQYEVSWNAAGFSSGLYFVRLSANGKNYVRKAILIK